jgi:hypothetical protein
MCGVGKFVKRWQQWDTDHCPRCGQLEDAHHVWVYKANGAKDVWSLALEDVECLLRKLDTDPTITYLFLTHLCGWHLGEEITYTAPIELEEVIMEQNNIGWDNFFKGVAFKILGHQTTKIL